MSMLKYWILAARPKTLPAAVVPVLVGGGLAAAADRFAIVPWSICLAFGILVQIGTNYANDYYDFVKGADDERRIGPSRAVASGWIPAPLMRRGMFITFAAAFAVGCLLVPFGGWWLLLVGAVSIACGIAYTGGPYPLGYNGWGDVFVFIFFGWVATGLTYFVQTGTFVAYLPDSRGAVWTLLAGMVPGALATNLLVVNNVRDGPLDAEAGKGTLVARFGRRFGYTEYSLLCGITLLVPLLFAILGGARGGYLILICLPLVVMAIRQLLRASTREEYGKSLVQAALMLMLAGGLFSLGLAIS